MSVPQSAILFRAGGATLAKYGVPWRRTRTDGREPEAPTFTRASTGARRNRTGVGRVAAADKLRLEYPPGLVDAFGNPLGGFLLEGARTQLVTDPENFGAWTAHSGTPLRSGGQADPFGGTAAYLVTDDDGAGVEAWMEIVTFTGDATKAPSIFMKFFSAGVSTLSIWDQTASAHRHIVDVTWTGGVPALSTLGGAGTLFPVEPWGNGWYRLSFNATGVVAANENRFVVYPAGTGAATGQVYIFGANAWNAVFPSSYQGPSGGATVRAADSLTFPIGFGPQDLTVYAKFARPVWADASGSIVANPFAFIIGGPSAPAPGTGSIRGGGLAASRTWTSYLDTATSDVQVDQSLPAGAAISVCHQWRNLNTTGGLGKLDVGSGFGAELGTGTPFNAWTAQTISIGRYDTGQEFYGVLIDLIVARGLYTLADFAGT